MFGIRSKGGCIELRGWRVERKYCEEQFLRWIWSKRGIMKGEKIRKQAERGDFARR